MGLPGLKMGPLDPDRTAEFGQVSATNSARTLIRLHSQAHPPELRLALARPLDPERTKGLVLDEVRGYLAKLKDDNKDPILPDGAKIVGAQVRGERDTEQILTFTYRTGKSGRTAKWFAEIDPKALKDSLAAGDELVAAQEMRDRGVVAFDSQGASVDVLRREAAGLRRQNEALREQVESAGEKGELGKKVEGDTRPDDQIATDNEDLRQENEELRAEVRRLAQATERLGQESLRPSGGEVAAQEPPYEGYDEANAKDVIKRLKADDTTDAEREEILAYERAHADRRSVVSAAEQAIGKS